MIDLRKKTFKRPRETELNLSPFIGLFALLVCTLLISALWDSLSVLDLGRRSDQTLDQSDLQNVLRVRLVPNRAQILSIDNKVTNEMSLTDLSQFLKSLNLQSTPVEILFDDALDFGQLIDAFEVFHANGASDLQIGGL